MNTKLDRAYSRDNEDKKISKLNTEVQRIVDESQERKEREKIIRVSGFLTRFKTIGKNQLNCSTLNIEGRFDIREIPTEDDRQEGSDDPYSTIFM